MSQFIDITPKVENALESMRPFLKADGGDVELVEITDEGIVRLRLLGSCRVCSMRTMTMKAGIEDAILKAVPQITAVEEVEEPAPEAFL